jgi:hypothetical protein
MAAIAGIAAVLVVAVSAAGLLLGRLGPRNSATWTLRPDSGPGEWTALEWHDITATAGEVFRQDPRWIGGLDAATGGILSWRGGYAILDSEFDLWTSKDGLSWAHVSGAPHVVEAVAVRGDLLATGLASDGTKTWLWLSSDAVKWQHISTPFADATTSQLAAGSTGVVAATTPVDGPDPRGPAVLYFSEDGLAWTRTALPADLAQARSVIVHPYLGGYLATGLVSDPNGSISFSDDSGTLLGRYSERTWISRDGIAWDAYGPKLPPGFTASDFGWTAMPSGRLGAGNDRIHSTDGGVTWTKDDYRLPYDLSGQLISDGTRIILAAGGGLAFYLSEGDGHWQKLAEGGDVGSLPGGGLAMLLPNGVLWVVGDRIYFGQGLSGYAPRGSLSPVTTPPVMATACTPLPMRPEAAAQLVQGGAAIVYERNGGVSCIDELSAVYADGRVISDFGDGNRSTTHLPTDQVTALLDKLTTIPDAAHGWFTDDWYSTYHPPCEACYQYSLTITYHGKTKTVGAVDGGTDAPSAYWMATAYLAQALGIQ